MYLLTKRQSWALIGPFPHIIRYERETGRTMRDGRPLMEEVEIHTKKMGTWPDKVSSLDFVASLLDEGSLAISYWRNR